MFEVEVRREFSAAHQLRGYNGNCSCLHGHNYGVIALLRTKKLDEVGIAVDFKKLKAVLDPILEGYDHTNLSEHPDFRQVNPTSENIARIIYRKLAAAFCDGNVSVVKVSVQESAGSCANYFEE